MLRVSCIVVEMLVLFIFSIFLTVLYVKFLALWLKCWYLAWFTSLPRGLFLSRANFSSAFSCLPCKCLFNLSHQRETPQLCFSRFSTFTFLFISQILYLYQYQRDKRQFSYFHFYTLTFTFNLVNQKTTK